MPEQEITLKNGEEILWSGKTKQYELLDTTNRPVFLFRLILCTLICIAVEILYIKMANMSGAGVQWGVLAVIFAACAASPILFLTRSMSLKKYRYYATNMRLILVDDQIREMPYERIPVCAFKQDADGNTSLLCGEKAVSSRPGRWRELTLFGNLNNDGVSPCDKFAFYAVDSPESLRSVLKDRIRIAD